MRKETIEIEIFTVDDLKEKQYEDVRNKVLERHGDINVDYPWYDHMTDGEDGGIVIEEFDLYGGTISGKFVTSAEDTARYIIDNHGETCDTYKIARKFFDEYTAHIVPMKIRDPECDPEEDDKAIEMMEEFRGRLLKAYLSMLKSEYEYRMSEEAIMETLECNNYEFTRDGKIYP